MLHNFQKSFKVWGFLGLKFTVLGILLNFHAIVSIFSLFFGIHWS